MLNLLKGSLGINGKKSSTPRKSGEDCTNGKECVSGKCSNSKCLKKPNEECSSKEECASNKCIDGKCLADDGWQQSQNKILSNVKYSEPKSTSPEILAKIRNTKREEPKNTGENHPTTLYMPIGHGGEKVGEKHIVPKGCILVVKSHSGDSTIYKDFLSNVKAVLNIDNNEVVFDPVSHKKELYSLLTSKKQGVIKNITAAQSTAIYREGDTYNNFEYQVVNKHKGMILTSGIVSLQHSTTDTDYKLRTAKIEDNTKAFVKDDSNNYIYSPDIITLNIPSYFSSSNTYPYYYTSQHIQDILDVILAFINLHKDGYIIERESEKKLVEVLGKRYLNIKKGYTYVEGVAGVSEHAPIDIILKEGISYMNYESTRKKYIKFKALNTRNIKDDPRNELIQFLRDMTLDRLFSIIIFMTNTSQADLFKDVEAGIIKPGIFYNLICRATKNTLHTNNKNMARASGILDTKYIENSDTSIEVKNQAGEIKNRISEAVLQRKNQAKQVFNDKAMYINNSVRVNDDTSDVITYYILMTTHADDNYTDLYNLERKKKDIKLQTFNYILSEINFLKGVIEDGSIGPEFKEDNNNELLEYNRVLSNFYSKNALLSENKKIAGMIATENDPKEKEFLKGKIDFNNKFIKDHIQESWFRPTQFISTPKLKNEGPKVLTNNYKKYRNEVTKKYKKVNGKWVENVNVGGRRLTRKRK